MCVCVSGGGGVPVAVDSGHTAVNSVRHRRKKMKRKTLVCETEGFYRVSPRQTCQAVNSFTHFHIPSHWCLFSVSPRPSAQRPVAQHALHTVHGTTASWSTSISWHHDNSAGFQYSVYSWENASIP